MVDFLNLSENKSNCGCSFLGHSMQLLPYQYDPYVLYIGDFTEYIYIVKVNVIDSYGNSTNILNVNGDQEHEGFIYLKNIQFNDVNNVVLEIILKDDNDDLKTLYSDPVKISSHNDCKTTRVNFKCLETDIMQSISFPFYYVQDKRSVELESAYQISVKNQMSYATANAKYKVYKTQYMSIDAINKLSDVLIMPFVYFDYKRVNLFDAIEIPEVQADERFGETTINVSEYKGIGTNDITPTLYIGTEINDDFVSTENDNYIILE